MMFSLSLIYILLSDTKMLFCDETRRQRNLRKIPARAGQRARKVED